MNRDILKGILIGLLLGLIMVAVYIGIGYLMLKAILMIGGGL